MAPSTPEGHLFVDGSQKYALVADLKAIAFQADAVARRTRSTAVEQATSAAAEQISPLANRVATLARELEGFVSTTDKIVVGGVEFKQDENDPLLYVPVEGKNVTIDGSAIQITGTVPTAADLPATAQQGQAVVALDTGHLHVWGIDSWVDAGPFRGPQGDPGEPGPAPQLIVGDVALAGEGEAAAVTISGPREAPIMDFLLPSDRPFIEQLVSETGPDNGARPVGKGELVVNVRDHGAEGDGTTDDTAAIQDAIDTAILGSTILFPPGEYVVSASLSVTKSVHLHGYGATLDARTLPAGTTFGQAVAIKVTGTVGTPVAVGTAVPKWSRTIAGVSSTGELSKGSLVVLSNEEQPIPGMTRPDRDKGELAVVQSVDSATQVTITTGSLFDYSTNGLTIAPVTPARDVTIRGFTLRLGGVGSVHNGIAATNAQDLTIEDVHIDGGEDTAISFHTVWNGVVKNSTVRNSTSPTIGNTGYGVAILDGSRHCLVQGNHFYNCRHFIAGGGRWPAAFIDVLDNHGEKSLDAAYDCHEPCFYWKFVGNTATGVRLGFVIRGQYITVDSNEITWSETQAYKVQTFDGVTEQRGIRLINNTSGHSMFGLLVDGRAAGAEPASLKIGAEIVGNTIHNSQGEGILLAHFQGAVVSGNTVSNALNRGINLMGITGTPSTGLVADGNRITGTGWQGIALTLVDLAVLQGNAVTGTGYGGLEMTSCNDVTISGLMVSAPARSGIQVMTCNRVALVGAAISGGMGTTYDAVRVTGSSDISIQGGHLASARHAIYTTTTDYVVVTGVNARAAANATKINVDATNKVIANNV